MARNHAKILTTIWTDPAWVALGSEAQRIYMLALSQPNLSYAGVVPYTARRWRILSRDSSLAAISRAVNELVTSGFVVVDESTEEMVIRTFLKHDGVFKSPNIIRAMWKDYRAIMSPLVRGVVRAQFPTPTPVTVVKAFPEGIPEPFREGLPEGFGEGFAEGSPREGLSPYPYPSPPLGRVTSTKGSGPTERPGAEQASAGAPAGGRPHDELPESYRTGPHADIAHLVLRTGDLDQDLQRLWTLMAHQHLERHTAAGGTRVMHPKGWLKTDADLTAQAYLDDARQVLTNRPRTWLDLIAIDLDPTLSPLDGGTHRSHQARLASEAELSEADAARAARDATPLEDHRAGAAAARAILHRDRADGGGEQ